MIKVEETDIEMQQHTDSFINKEEKEEEPVKGCTNGPLHFTNNFLDVVENNSKELYLKRKKLVNRILSLLLFLAFTSYVVAACVINFTRARALLYLTIFVFCCLSYGFLKKQLQRCISERIVKPLMLNFTGNRKIIKIGAVILLLCFILFWLIYDTGKDPSRLVSLAGLLVFILIGYLFSSHRSQIKWRPVIWGLTLQFILGLFILRTRLGVQIFRWIGDRVSTFMNFANAGSSYLFGDLTMLAFQMCPVIVFFSAFTQLLLYFGVIEVLVKKVGWLLEVTLGTSPAESFNAASNIFLGPAAAALMIRPFLQDMTESELHAVMTGGFATMAGTMLAIYIKFGVSAAHLISASIMSAPAALAMSKLLCPEVEEPSVKSVNEFKLLKPKENNIFEAVTEGATVSVKLISGILVNIIAFISLQAFADAILAWLGSMVDIPELSCDFIASYVFMPFAFVMGVTWNDSFIVGELLGTRTFVSGFISYKKLSVYIRNRNIGNGIMISARSEAIATYALCGYTTIGSIGLSLGILGALVPSKRGVLAKHVLRALITGTFACFLTACVAGMLYEDEAGQPFRKSVINTTIVTTNLTRKFQQIP